MGQSLDLHPVSVLLALMVWGAVWGVIGMFLATPLTAIIASPRRPQIISARCMRSTSASIAVGSCPVTIGARPSSITLQTASGTP